MALTFKIFSDAALTTEQTGNLVATQNADGSTPPVEFQLWLGSLGSAGGNTADRKVQADSDPGVAGIDLTVVDTTPGSGHEVAEVKLATTQGGLAGATGGALLALAATLTSGTANAVEFWVSVDDATGVIGTAVELSVDTVLLRETDV